MTSVKGLQQRAAAIRREVMEVALSGGAGHIAPSLSCVDILIALYYRVLRRDDVFILSKSHGCYAQYAILADLGKIPTEEWRNFYRSGELKGCAERRVEWGLEAGCGALGHGLPMAVGLAWAAKLDRSPRRVFCLVGDGELQEGSNWEALQVAAYHRLDNLFLIVDGNRLQAMDFLDKILNFTDSEQEILGKLAAFGCAVGSCDGHDMEKLLELFEGALPSGHPFGFYCRTIKGYGLKAMENQPKFHFRLPDEAELAAGWRDDA